jgi:hypothetical protein
VSNVVDFQTLSAAKQRTIGRYKNNNTHNSKGIAGEIVSSFNQKTKLYEKNK